MRFTKKILTMATCAVMAASSMVGVSASALTPYENSTIISTMATVTSTTNLTVNTYDQEKDNWCWAACTRMLLDFYNEDEPESQSTIVKKVKGSVIDEGGNEDDVITALTAYLDGNYTYTKVPTRNIDYDTIRKCINKNKPIYLKLKQTNNTYHAVICSGYRVLSDGTTQLYIHDPGKSTADYWGTIDSDNVITNGSSTKGTVVSGLYCND